MKIDSIIIPTTATFFGFPMSTAGMVNAYQQGDLVSSLFLAPLAAYFGYCFYRGFLRGELFNGRFYSERTDFLKMLYNKTKSKF